MIFESGEPAITYEIGEQIGDGGYGHVYKARDKALHRDVAIKFIRTSAGDEEFAKEQARALCRCKCENVVTVFALEELEDPVAKGFFSQFCGWTHVSVLGDIASLPVKNRIRVR